MSNELNKRYEFVLFFEVENGNPNGDPDAGNMPRTDPETSHGLVSKAGKDFFDIYVRENSVLNDTNLEAYKKFNLKHELKKLPKDPQQAKDITKYMCDRFYDIRTFGAVMTTEVNCGQVRGPIQFCFAKSLDPIVPQEVTITRMAVTNAKDAEKERTMGRKHIVPYAVYRVEGYISAALACKTGFSEEDLELFWEALMNMFENDHSAARGKMSSRKLVVFEHSSLLGNAPAHKLFDLVKVKRNDVEKPPRAFADYSITVEHNGKPDGVTIIER